MLVNCAADDSAILLFVKLHHVFGAQLTMEEIFTPGSVVFLTMWKLPAVFVPSCA